MESGFLFFLKMGVTHITDWQAYDHMLFLLAICVPYSLKNWKRVVALATAFTVGHSITLILNGLGILDLDQDLIEFLIPVTIALAAGFHLYSAFRPNKYRKYGQTLTSFKWEYILVVFFGLIHGAGFSNFFKSMFSQEDGIVGPLLAFNLGVELGQIGIISIILVLQFFLVSLLGLKHRWWWIGSSALSLIIAVRWIIENIMG